MPSFSETVDFSKQEARNLVTHKLASAPSSPVAGQRYYDTTLNKEGVYNGSSWDYAGAGGVTGLGLLVYAQQNTSIPMIQYVSTLVPFSAEVIDGQNLFSAGYFTPAVTGAYRLTVGLNFSAYGELSYHAVEVWVGEVLTFTLYRFETYVAYSRRSHPAVLPLTAGTAYHIRLRSSGPTTTIDVAADCVNSLAIERLS